MVIVSDFSNNDLVLERVKSISLTNEQIGLFCH